MSSVVRSPPAYCTAVYRGRRYQRLWWYNLSSWGWAACCWKHVEDRSVTYILLKNKRILHYVGNLKKTDKHVTNHAIASMDRRHPSSEDHNTFNPSVAMGFNFHLLTRTNGFIIYSTLTRLHDWTTHRQWHWGAREGKGSKHSATVPYPKPPNSGTRSKIFSKHRSQIFPLRQKDALLWPNIFWSLPENS